MQLTANFKDTEIIGNRNLTDFSERTQGMVKAMANMLQGIRDRIGKPISINSGLRVAADYERLKAQGYNPSATSDHFFGQRIPLTAGTSAYAKYGAYHDLSVGACDIVCPSLDPIDFFNLLLKMRYDGELMCGQLLLEKANTYWVHIANNPDEWLTAEQKAKRGQQSLYGIGTSLNNGETFKFMDWGDFYGTYNQLLSYVSLGKYNVAKNPVPAIIVAAVIVGTAASVIVIRNNRNKEEAMALLDELAVAY